MNEKKKKIKNINLRFKKGDLIVKQGDFGISVYNIKAGQVSVYNEIGDREIPLANLGRGEVVGEMAFLNRGTKPRAASARAIQDCELEVWHPNVLKKEYEELTPVIKYIANQAIKRLVRMNSLITQLSARKKQQRVTMTQAEPENFKRSYYRKDVKCVCSYRPVNSSPKLRLPGVVKDISLGGVEIEIWVKNALDFPHDIGDAFYIKIDLQTGKDLNVTARIRSVDKDTCPGKFLLGMKFDDLNGDSTKTLGFFMRT